MACPEGVALTNMFVGPMGVMTVMVSPDFGLALGTSATTFGTWKMLLGASITFGTCNTTGADGAALDGEMSETLVGGKA